MARKPATRAEYTLFDVVYEDGSQRSNRRVPSGILGGPDGDAPARAVIEEQDRLIAEKSGKPALAVKSIRRSGGKKAEPGAPPRASEATGRPRTITPHPGSSARKDFLFRSGNETVALRLLARELALPS